MLKINKQIVDSRIVNSCKQDAAKGVSIEETITRLHTQGLTIVQSIKVLRLAYGLSSLEAKASISKHPLWEKVVTAAEPLHDELIQNVATFLKPVEETAQRSKKKTKFVASIEKHHNL